MAPRLLLCDCEKTQTLDAKAIERATGLACSRVHTSLCATERGEAAQLIASGEVIVACGQEHAFFEALAEAVGAPDPLCVDIRDRAGWSKDRASKAPKIAALLAIARLAPPPEKTFDVVSEGLCLILGESAVALPTAARLADALSVTCVLSDAPEPPTATRRAFDTHRGRIRSASGALGAFSVTFDGFEEGRPGGREPGFAPPTDGAESECDIILDLRGGPPLFPAYEKREGYLRADPGDPNAVARAVFDAAQMVGTFEKPLHIAFTESLCAHSRAGQTGCTRCLDLCPTGAIAPDGDSVRIDPLICAGCGACAAVCPSGAAAHDNPPAAHVFALTRIAAAAYRDAGGDAPRLLVHDSAHGREMISLAARCGRGLPADVVPLEVEALAGFGHAEMLVALANGFTTIDMLLGPKADRQAIEPQIELAAALANGAGVGAGRIRMLDPVDPDALSDALYVTAPPALKPTPILPLDARRAATRLAAKALAGEDTPAPYDLPGGAPYGAVLLNQDACTLCLSCASLCPTAALTDNPDKPQLRFQEDACLQCGLCATICPENAITLAPRMNLADAAFSQIVLHEEEPYPCIECGALFGVRSTVERIVEKLEGKHSMFTNSDNTRLIRMCDDCRVKAQYHGESAPLFGGDRPHVRTTQDYLDERKS